MVITPAGSSPRMRGTPGRRDPHQPEGRFIPAHAGNTYSVFRARPALAVHPRACGEHSEIVRAALEAYGSSPRMRGTHKETSIFRRKTRFIPAHAGNTVIRWVINQPWAVHPRACGEHGVHPNYPAGISRFIPAHAGNTPLSPRPQWRHDGSSPRMRGTLASRSYH